jgi:hypothetical protein
MATLLIERPRQFLEMRRYRIVMDGVKAFTIGPGQNIEIDILPGRHRIIAWIDYATSNPVDLEATEGGYYRLKVGSNVAGWRLLIGVVYATVWRHHYLYLKNA